MVTAVEQIREYINNHSDVIEFIDNRLQCRDWVVANSKLTDDGYDDIVVQVEYKGLLTASVRKEIVKNYMTVGWKIVDFVETIENVVIIKFTS